MNEDIKALKAEFRNRIVLLVLTSIVLLLALWYVSFGWYANNRHVVTNDTSISAEKADVELAYRIMKETPTEWDILDDDEDLELTHCFKKPGDYVDLELRITNVGETQVNVTSAGFKPVDNSLEKKEEVGETYILSGASSQISYYLGSQLTVNLEKVLINDTILNIEDSFKEPKDMLKINESIYHDGGGPRMALLDSKGQIVSEKVDFFTNAVGEAKLLKGETCVMTIRITFVEDELHSQDMYKHFGDGTKCYNHEVYQIENSDGTWEPDTSNYHTGVCARRFVVGCEQ